MDIEKLLEKFRERLLDLKIDDVKEIKSEKEETILSIYVDDGLLNPYKIAHGGSIYALADTTAGLISIHNGFTPITLNSSFNFLKPANKDQYIYSKAVPVHIGRDTFVTEVKIIDSTDTLIAYGTFTMFNSKKYKLRRMKNE